jgi:hypothetical protein
MELLGRITKVCKRILSRVAFQKIFISAAGISPSSLWPEIMKKLGTIKTLQASGSRMNC